MAESTQETNKLKVQLDFLNDELVAHRTILQGMAVHLQKLQGEVFDLQQAFEGLMAFLREEVKEESADEDGSPMEPRQD